MRKALVTIILFLSCQPVISQQQIEIPWPTLADSPWPMISHDPQATGRSPYVGPKTPYVKWTMDMPYGVYSGPLLGEDGVLYFGTNSHLFGDTTNYFYAASPEGTLKWTYSTGSRSANNSGFLVGSDSTIYFGSQSGLLHAVDLEGNRKWVYDSGSNIFSRVINTDLQGNIYFANVTGYLHSIDRDGELNWRENFNGGFYAASTAIAPDGQTIYVGGRDSNFYALNLDGSIKWTFSCKAAWCDPMVDNEGNVYFAPSWSPWVVYSLTTEGDIRWEYFLSKLQGVPALYSGFTMDKNGNIYFTIQDGSCECSGITSLDYYGNFRWTYLFDDPVDDIYAPLMCDTDGTIYCGSTWGYYYYAITQDGELLWKLPLNGYWYDNSGSIGADGTLCIGVHKQSWVTGQERTLIAVQDSGTSSVGGEITIPEDYNLFQNFPNPFNPLTKIAYTIEKSDFVTLKVYDMLGKEISVLVNEYQSSGEYLVTYNPKNLASGMYVYQIIAGDFIAAKKLIFLK